MKSRYAVLFSGCCFWVGLALAASSVDAPSPPAQPTKKLPMPAQPSALPKPAVPVVVPKREIKPASAASSPASVMPGKPAMPRSISAVRKPVGAVNSVSKPAVPNMPVAEKPVRPEKPASPPKPAQPTFANRP